MDFFEYDKRAIEEFFSKNKNLFFPNGKYYKEDVISAVLNYCQELNVKFEQNDSKRYYLFDEAGLATGLDYEEMKEWEERGYPGSKKFTDEMWEATIDTKHSFEDLVYLRSIILNKSHYTTPMISFMSLSKETCLSNCEKLLKEIGYFNKN